MNKIINYLNAYIESHESDPPEIRDGFKELDNLFGRFTPE